MGYRREPLAVGEWYHCYNRGLDKRVVFNDTVDYERFLQALYLSNSSEPTDRNAFEHIEHPRVFLRNRSAPIVAIGAYTLMPNHFHILLQEIVEGGITRFMHKLGTSYTMYFNIKNKRNGNLFAKPFRSRHVSKDGYFKHVAQYIHLNLAELFEREWRSGKVASPSTLEKNMRAYRFSSLQDYCGIRRVERVILNEDSVRTISEGLPTLMRSLRDAEAYYAGLS